MIKYKSKVTILGIESSCDDTAVAILEDDLSFNTRDILNNSWFKHSTYKANKDKTSFQHIDAAEDRLNKIDKNEALKANFDASVLETESNIATSINSVAENFVIDNQNVKILANLVKSQNEHHAEYKGVVPEIAARAHMQNLQTLIDDALKMSDRTFKDIDIIAATCGPGLIGGVIVGSMYGRALSSVLDKPFIAVNHLEGHALTGSLSDNIDFPYLLLLVSGGHCQFIAAHGLGKYKIIGQTVDDAVGEAFDKVGKMMDIDFPAGPQIEILATKGKHDRFSFPRPMQFSKDANMSFSGLKTAVRLQIEKLGKLSAQDKCDIAASFQESVKDILTSKVKNAIKIYEENFDDKSSMHKKLVVGGGVAANQHICKALKNIAIENEYKFAAPPINLCTDNAAMIAFVGLQRFKAGIIEKSVFKPRARWSLEEV